MIGQVLRAHALAAITQGDEKVPVAVEYQTRTEVHPGVGFRLQTKQHLGVVQGPAFEPSACHGRADAARPGLGKAEIDPAVVRELRVQDHVEQASLAVPLNWWQAINRPLDQGAVGLDHAQAPRALGNQETAIRKEGDRPGVLKALGERLYTKTLYFRVVRFGGQGSADDRMQQQCGEQTADGDIHVRVPAGLVATILCCFVTAHNP